MVDKSDEASSEEKEATDRPKRQRGRPRGSYDNSIDWVAIERAYVYGEEIEREGDDSGLPPPRRYPSVREIANRFGVHPSLVGRRSRSLRWMERREKFKERVVEETDAAVAKALALSTADAVALIDGWVRTFERNVKDERVRADNVGDLNTMLRLREFLLGGADSRSEQQHTLSLEAMQERHTAARRLREASRADGALVGVIDEADPVDELEDDDEADEPASPDPPQLEAAPPPAPAAEFTEKRQSGLEVP